MDEAPKVISLTYFCVNLREKTEKFSLAELYFEKKPSQLQTLWQQRNITQYACASITDLNIIFFFQPFNIEIILCETTLFKNIRIINI
jgi:hypothetical protein